MDYAKESVKENEILDKTASILENAIGGIENIRNPIDFGDLSAEEINAMIGQYVKYVPTAKTFTDHTNADYSGYSGNSPISTDTNTKWRIMYADENILRLISNKTVNSGFTLSGANGYNNGVLLCNNACQALYSNSKIGATGRNINIDDLEKYMLYDKNNYPNYNNEYLPANTSYPLIFAEERTGAPNGTYGIKYGLSEQLEYISGTANGNTEFKGKYTYYTFKMSETTMQDKYIYLFNNSSPYWLASRCVAYYNDVDRFGFSMFYINGSTVNANNLYRPYNGESRASYGIRPIVEIDLTKVDFGVTGTGAENDGYSLTLK